jgi:integrase
VQFRDLRRSTGTILVQAGVPLQVVSRILGHTSTAVTERVYAHLDVRQLREGLSVMEAMGPAAPPIAPPAKSGQRPKRRVSR